MDERSEKLKEDLHQELLEVKVHFSFKKKILYPPIIHIRRSFSTSNYFLLLLSCHIERP